MSEQVYDTPLDDSGYSEPFTVEDFIREAEEVCKWLYWDKILIYWSLLKREAHPREHRLDLGTEIEDPYWEFRRSERQEYNFNHS